MKTYEYEFPLKHQEFVIEDVEFRNRLYRVMGVGHPFVSFWRRIESVRGLPRWRPSTPPWSGRSTA